MCDIKTHQGTSLVVQWLRRRAPNAGGLTSIPGQGTRSHRPSDVAKKGKKRERKIQFLIPKAEPLYHEVGFKTTLIGLFFFSK